MRDVPRTVVTALEDRPVAGSVCLEAGAGVGDATVGLLDAGARRVYAVTNDRTHAETVRERVVRDQTRRDEGNRTAVLEADVRALPLATDSVDVVTAHALFNLVAPSSLDSVAAELTRVAAPGCHLVVDDYDPLPTDAAVRDLFAVENAASELARGRPAQTFYPAALFRRLFAGCGWAFDRELTLLEPVPWTAGHLAAHARTTRATASEIAGEEERGGLAERLSREADRLAERIGEESAGRMYSLAFRLPA